MFLTVLVNSNRPFTRPRISCENHAILIDRPRMVVPVSRAVGSLSFIFANLTSEMAFL